MYLLGWVHILQWIIILFCYEITSRYDNYENDRFTNANQWNTKKKFSTSVPQERAALPILRTTDCFMI